MKDQKMKPDAASLGTRSNEIFASTVPFQTPIARSSVLELATSFGGFFSVCTIMYLYADLSLWMTLPLAALAAGFLVRIFIIQHDCGHGSFFKSRRINNAIGMLCSLITLAPYALWRRQHAAHHGSWNNLDRRAEKGMDIYSSCLTVAEYHQLGPWQKRAYRLVRHPLVSNLLLPPLIFLFLYRVPFDMAKGWGRERRAVYLTDAALAVLIGGLGLIVGYGRVATVQLTIMIMASIVGVGLFSIQHRFEQTLWVRNAEWDFTSACLHSSSYLRLPRVLQWFTGNIGFHHLHHLNPRIPNYRLEACHQHADAAVRTAPMLRIRTAFLALQYVLWDEDQRRMVPCPSSRDDGRSRVYSVERVMGEFPR